jgi:hypothetical protein
MPRSKSSEDSDQESLISHDFVELELGEKPPLYTISPSHLRHFISSCNAKPLIISILMVATIFISTFATLHSYSSSGALLLSNDCGSTGEEALALGCKFDVINYSWQPAACFDEEVYNRYWEKWTLEYQNGRPFKMYTDPGFTQELPSLDLKLLMRTPLVWAEHRVHILHCMYAWELMHHALTLGRPLPAWLASFNHTRHCTETVLQEDWTEHDTTIKAQHSGCVMLA